jgi:hypothetical protein
MKSLIIVYLFLCIGSIKAQQHSVQTKNQLSFDVGICPTPTIKTSSTLTFKTALHHHIIYSIRLRSFNTYYFYSKSAYLVSPQVEFFLHNNFSKFNFLVGVGFENQVTLNDKSRNINSSSYSKPLITATFMGSFHCLRYQVQDRITITKDGIGMTLLPEIVYRAGDNYSIYIRYELGMCKRDNFPTSVFKQHLFVGVQLMF